METVTRDDVKRLYLHFAALFGSKFTSAFVDDEIMTLWVLHWHDGLKDMPRKALNFALDRIKLSNQWSPTLAEFRSHCEEFSGLPGVEQVLNKLLRKEHDHEIIGLVAQKIDSWALSHDSESVLMPKIARAYADAKLELRKSKIAQIEQYNCTKNGVTNNVNRLDFAQ
jgi:hypothetical protein